MPSYLSPPAGYANPYAAAQELPPLQLDDLRPAKIAEEVVQAAVEVAGPLSGSQEITRKISAKFQQEMARQA